MIQSKGKFKDKVSENDDFSQITTFGGLILND